MERLRQVPFIYFGNTLLHNSSARVKLNVARFFYHLQKSQVLLLSMDKNLGIAVIFI